MARHDLIMVRIPEKARNGNIILRLDKKPCDRYSIKFGREIAARLFALSNPAVDKKGNVYSTFLKKGSQSSDASISRISPSGVTQTFAPDVSDPTGLLFKDDFLYVTSRRSGRLLRLDAKGKKEVIANDLGIATGIAMDEYKNIFVGDRTGKILRIDASGNISQFAQLSASMSSYHLAVHPDGTLFVTSPSMSNRDPVYRIDKNGRISVFLEVFDRARGILFDQAGNLYVCGILKGEGGIYKVSAKKNIRHIVAGTDLTGLAFAPAGAFVIAGENSLYKLPFNLSKRLLP